MRTNLPVTATEYLLQDGLAIVSKTDLKGRITYVNPYFIEVSGFAETELLGAPHNLVRHPDMPPEAFADLWSTLKAGIPWTGMVKNRRKNGDYYWVMANVTPVHEDGRTVGYMSVRTKPTRAQVEAADELYRQMRTGSAPVVLRRGALVRKGWRGKVDAARQLSLNRRLAVSMGLLCLLMLALAGLGAAAASGVPGLAGWIAAAGGGGIAVALLLWGTLHAALVQPLQHALKTARAIAAGDLSQHFDIRRRDDLGQLQSALQQMNVNLQAIIGDVQANVEIMTRGTREIADGNQGLATRTEAQAASLRETAASMEQLAAAVRQNASSAGQANRLSLSASAVASKGGQVVEQVVRTMDEISASSHKVVDIVGLIDSIAFQTNMLALNASVEAARAGEQGRGFAVVATEVRNLAQRCAGAAKEIKELINVAADKVDDGNALVSQAGATMGEIVESVDSVTSIVSGISDASAAQNTGIDSVNRALVQMEDSTTQNAALVEQAAAAAAALADQAERLSQAVSVFRLASAARAGQRG